mmetsp:Transcript_15602/g.38651  ORF Transcript_15602/g.38651 Transcript_15602/m.38651 type:complete len:315 (-) Transcript_15602:1359-2303(-)
MRHPFCLPIRILRLLLRFEPGNGETRKCGFVHRRSRTGGVVVKERTVRPRVETFHFLYVSASETLRATFIHFHGHIIRALEHLRDGVARDLWLLPAATLVGVGVVFRPEIPFGLKRQSVFELLGPGSGEARVCGEAHLSCRTGGVLVKAHTLVVTTRFLEQLVVVLLDGFARDRGLPAAALVGVEDAWRPEPPFGLKRHPLWDPVPIRIQHYVPPRIRLLVLLLDAGSGETRVSVCGAVHLSCRTGAVLVKGHTVPSVVTRPTRVVLLDGGARDLVLGLQGLTLSRGIWFFSVFRRARLLHLQILERFLVRAVI